jgi:hypothetical protein
MLPQVRPEAFGQDKDRILSQKARAMARLQTEKRKSHDNEVIVSTEQTSGTKFANTNKMTDMFLPIYIFPANSKS